MRAHIARTVKAKCKAREIAMCVIPGGLTAYLQVGDIGIYKQFKDHLSVGTQGVEGQTVMDNSIAAAGISPIESDWFIWCHDVYGRQFQREWERDKKCEDNLNSGVEEELANVLDDVELVDE
ncbi:unnamed protein product [Phytophthora fragariaefolia]|uniref:Unnamed protein product n=1 Tax=Phytophthora fragariaefolia TaxID=1490495 RepID=A0A9W6XJ26_9STRA|nr:unnamed protein product [Phytophthora fragariaefolia]